MTIKLAIRALAVAAWVGAFVFAGLAGLAPDFAQSAAFMWLGALPLVLLGTVLLVGTD